MDELAVLRDFQGRSTSAGGAERAAARELLVAAIETALAPPARQPSPGRRRRRAFLVALAAAVAIAVPAVAFAGQIGHLIDSLAGREAARNALPDTGLLRVFQRPATSADVLPESARATLRQFAGGVPTADPSNPGVAEVTRSRRVLSDVGTLHASLYLVPTAKGTLCMVWVPDIAGGCTQGFMEGQEIIQLRGSRGNRSYVWGIARDDVVAVDAVVGGAREPIAQGENAFYFEGQTLPDKLVLSLADSSTKTVPVGAIQRLNP